MIFLKYWRIGFRSYLVTGMCLLLLVFLYDIFVNDYKVLLSFNINVSYLLHAFSLALVLLFLLPSLAGFARVLLGSELFQNSVIEPFVSLQSRKVSIFIVVLALICSLAYYFSFFLEIQRGYSLDLTTGNMRFSHPSYFNRFAHYFTSLLFLLGYTPAIIFFIINFLISENKSIERHKIETDLIDLKSEFYPVHRRSELMFNNSAITPRIKFVKLHASRSIDKYHDLIPGSFAAKMYLLDVFNAVISKIRNVVFNGVLPDYVDVEIYSLTTRAFDAALLNIKGDNVRIVLSPFEHETIVSHVKTISKYKRYSYTSIMMKKQDKFFRDDDFIVAEIKSKIEKLSIDENETVVFVLSEVFYATGRIIPVRKILDSISHLKYKIIIDGSQSIGNIDQPVFRDGYDYLFFSAQKWLLSSVPMGVLLKKKVNDNVFLFDSWRSEDIPYATVDINNIAHFNSSLELINRISIKEIQRRRHEQINYFLELIRMGRDKFSVVPINHTQSGIVAIYPKGGYRWIKQNRDELRRLLEDDKKIYGALVNMPINGNMLLRLSFSYYLDGKTIKSLVKRLNTCVTRI